jgi:hypothetical protein
VTVPPAPAPAAPALSEKLEPDTCSSSCRDGDRDRDMAGDRDSGSGWATEEGVPNGRLRQIVALLRDRGGFSRVLIRQQTTKVCIITHVYVVLAV